MPRPDVHIAVTTALLAIPPTYFVTAHAEQLADSHPSWHFRVTPLAARVQEGATTLRVTPALRGPLPYSMQTRMAKFAMPLQARMVTRQSPDLIHQHHGTWSGGAVSASSARRIPLITTLHGTDVVHASRSRPRGLERVHAAQVRRAMRESLLLLPVSEHLRRLAIESGAPADRLHVHYQGIDTNFFTPGDHGHLDRHPRILYVGALIPQKRVDLAIRASQELAREQPHELLIIGDGPQRSSLVAMARDSAHIRFLGPLDRDGVRSMMRMSDLLLLLSHSEGAGLVSLEAQACGMAVIVTDGDGKKEMIRDGITGTVVGADATPGAIARAASTWLPDNPQMRHEISTAARDFVVTERSVHAGASRLAEFYESALG